MGVAIAGLAGTALSAYGQYRQGQYEADVADNNARLMDYQRRDAIQRGEYDASDIEKQGMRESSEARAVNAAGNVEGKGVDVAADIPRYTSAIDAARVRAQAAREAWGFENEAQDLRARAKAQRKAGILGAFGTTLSGAGNAMTQYAASRQKGG
jgi:hypothetical protein